MRRVAYPSSSQGREDGGGVGTLRGLLLLLLLLQIVSSDSIVSKLNNRAAVRICKVLAEGDVGNANVGRGGNGLLSATLEFETPREIVNTAVDVRRVVDSPNFDFGHCMSKIRGGGGGTELTCRKKRKAPNSRDRVADSSSAGGLDDSDVEAASSVSRAAMVSWSHSRLRTSSHRLSPTSSDPTSLLCDQHSLQP